MEQTQSGKTHVRTQNGRKGSLMGTIPFASGHAVR